MAVWTMIFVALVFTQTSASDLDYTCGYPYELAIYMGEYHGENVWMYYLNDTAERLSAEGYSITVDNMTKDAIMKFTASNATSNETYEFSALSGVAAVGGKPASRIRAYYMAQLGEVKEDGEILWLCDGVLINREWVLSAAHCFVLPGINPNLVRLGDYNLTEPVEENFSPFGKYINDYEMAEVVFHPGFNPPSRYHDLVLIRIPSPTPYYSNSINPICLPWNEDPEQSIVGSTVILTGWGATKYGGKKSDVLQQVELEVFNTTICDRNYSPLPGYRRKYRDGMNDESILCVGWRTDGKDACRGDSGAPVVMDKEEKSIIVMGIVSGGYGCGKREFPGLYIPIFTPKYLHWINETAFK